MRLSRLMIPAAMVAAAFVGGALPSAHAASSSGVKLGSAGSPVRHLTLPSRGIPFAGTHYVYVETGQQSPSDSIDSYSCAGTNCTLLGNFPVPGSTQNFGYFGANSLGIDGSCLIFANSAAPGNTYSLKIGSNHQPSAVVSTMPSVSGGTPDQVMIDGNYAVINESTGPSGLAVYAINTSTCALTLTSSITFASGANVLSSVLVAQFGPHHAVLSPDYTNSVLYLTKISATGMLSALPTTPSQLPNPGSAASDLAKVETGALLSPTQMQQGTATPLGVSFTGNGAGTSSDGSGSNGDASWWDQVGNHWVLGEQGSASLGFFNEGSGSSGPTFASHQGTPDAGAPTAFQQLGPILIFLDAFTGAVDYCHVTSGTSGGCGAITTAFITSNYLFGAGIVVV